MERHEEQEQEFWARLGEQGISRSQMLRRSLAAAAGLTVMGAAPGAASGARRLMRATPPTRGSQMSLNDLVAEAKKEGHLNTIALPLQAAAGQLIADLPPARAAALPVGARVAAKLPADGARLLAL